MLTIVMCASEQGSILLLRCPSHWRSVQLLYSMLTEADALRRAGADLVTLLVAGGQQGYELVGSGTLPNGAPMGPEDLPIYALDHNWSRMEKLVLRAAEAGSDSALLGQLLRAGIVRRLARLIVDFAPLALSYEYRGLCDFDPLIASVSRCCYDPLDQFPSMSYS